MQVKSLVEFALGSGKRQVGRTYVCTITALFSQKKSEFTHEHQHPPDAIPCVAMTARDCAVMVTPAWPVDGKVGHVGSWHCTWLWQALPEKIEIFKRKY